MADARRRDSTPGLVSTLLGIAFLVVIGFGLGVVAGLLVEEPDLVLDYAAGDTESVALPGEEPGNAVSSPPAGEPEPSGVAEAPAGGPPRAEAPAAAEPPAAPARPAPAASAGSFAVQVGAFGESAAAQGLADRLRAEGYPVYVSPSAPDGGPRRWRVRVGPVETRPQAERLAERLQGQALPTWVLAEDAG